MPDEHTIAYATPAAPKPVKVKWTLVALPLIMAAGPILFALFFFRFGYGGMAFAALALLSGFIASPVAAILAIINCITYRQNRRAMAWSLFALAIAAGTLFYEFRRMMGQWD